MTINTSNLGGGNGFKLAPDLTYPSDIAAGTGIKQVVGINAVGALTEALGLAGKFAISFLQFSSVASESITIKLTVDGVVIWNDTFSNTSPSINLLGTDQSVSNTVAETVVCNSSASLEIQTTADASVTLQYSVRPIL